MSIDNLNRSRLKNQRILLEVSGISKKFPEHDTMTLDNINLSIYEGEFFALLGPSGCGKTTLMRILAGFDEPDKGHIYIDNTDMTYYPPHLRPINMMFQSYALFPHMNVYDNIAFGLKQEKLEKSLIDERVMEVLEVVKMQDLRNRNINELSGGQQQRIALARCIAKRPKILLLDEPLGALDLKTREHTQLELMNIQHMLGITFIMVTHNQQEAMAMANRMAVMDKGRILQIGTPADIYDYPNSSFVADFIGSINMFKARVSSVNDEENYLEIELTDFTGQLIRVREQNKFSIGTEVVLGVRPEEMHISLTMPQNDDNYITAEVMDISFIGDQFIYHTKSFDTMIMVTHPTAARMKRNDIVIGSRVYLSWHDTDGIILPT